MEADDLGPKFLNEFAKFVVKWSAVRRRNGRLRIDAYFSDRPYRQSRRNRVIAAMFTKSTKKAETRGRMMKAFGAGP